MRRARPRGGRRLCSVIFTSAVHSKHAATIALPHHRYRLLRLRSLWSSIDQRTMYLEISPTPSLLENREAALSWRNRVARGAGRILRIATVSVSGRRPYHRRRQGPRTDRARARADARQRCSHHVRAQRLDRRPAVSVRRPLRGARRPVDAIAHLHEYRTRISVCQRIGVRQRDVTRGLTSVIAATWSLCSRSPRSRRIPSAKAPGWTLSPRDRIM